MTPSAKAALQILLPKLLPTGATFQVHAHQGKPALLRRLPDRLRAYATMSWPQLRLLVLIDGDREDCHELKSKLERMAAEAGLTTKTAAESDVFQVVNRIAIEELEAWFFGDVEALRTAYPKVPSTLANRARYREPDAVPGGTAEALARVLRNAGYYQGSRLPKLTVASAVAPHLDPSRNRSPSFRCFCDGVRSLMEVAAT